MEAMCLLTLLVVALQALPAQNSPERPKRENPVPPPRSSYLSTDFPWVMFHYDSAHTGFTPATAPNNPGLLWTVTTGGGVSSSPVVAEGIVYAGSLDASIYAVDESSGGILWTWRTNGPITGSPAIMGGMLYVVSQDRTLYALSAKTGQLVWSSIQIAPLQSSPVIAGGKLFFGTQYDSTLGTAKVVSVNATNGTTVWSYDWPASINSSPAVDGGRVFVGTTNGRVLALDETTGRLIWLYQAGTSQVSAPAVTETVVYVTTSSNRVFALDTGTGAVKWSQNLGGLSNPTPSSPAVGMGRVILGTGRGQLVAFNATNGIMLWSTMTGGEVSSSPALTRDTVLVGSGDGRLYAVDSASGTLKWALATGGPVLSSPALQVSVSTAPSLIRAGQDSTISILVTANSVAQSGVSLVLTSSPPANTTAVASVGQGIFTASYTAPLVVSQTLVVFDVAASKPGYVSGSGRGGVIVEPPSPLTINLSVEPVSISPGSNATLTLQLLNGSAPVIGAVVTAQSTVGGQFSSVLDLGNGNYTLSYSPPDRDFKEPTPLTVMVAASKPGFVSVSSTAQLVLFGSKPQPRSLPQIPIVPIVAVGSVIGLLGMSVYLLKRDKGGRPRTLERSLEFDEALLRAFDSAFELVGTNVWRAIMRTVQDQFGLKREEFPEKLETFDEALVATLGKGLPLLKG